MARNDVLTTSLVTLRLDDVVDESATFEPDALRACKALARTKPWQGGFDQRIKALAACFDALCQVYGIEGWILAHCGPRFGLSGGSKIDPQRKRVLLSGRLSVVTMLHLFAKVRRVEVGADRGREQLDAADHLRAIRWSVNIFRRCFPISFGRCRLIGGLLINDGRRDD